MSRESWRGCRDLRSITLLEQQLEEGIIEVVPERSTGEAIHYILYQPVIRDQAESIKMRIVYDYSTKAISQVRSLNECLEVGPFLQPTIFDILLRNRLKLLCVTGDIQKAFFRLKWTQRIEMPFVCYGTRPLTQGRYRSIHQSDFRVRT